MQTTTEEDTCFLTPGGDWADAFKDLQVTINDERDVINRIWKYDYTLWKEKPTDIVNRLGWLHSPEKMLKAIPDLTAFTDEVRKAGFTQVILCGMGGSSLAPEVYRYTFGVREGYLDLRVLDSTDPGAVLEIERSIDLEKTLFIVSTKSGGTVETASFMKFFYKKTAKAVGNQNVGEHFIAITDPGSGLESTARKLKFRRIFLNDPHIGGRYSALSYFGLVPGGVDWHGLKTASGSSSSHSKRFQ